MSGTSEPRWGRQSTRIRAIRRQQPSRSKLAAFQVESLECRRLLAGDDVLIDPLPPEALGVVSGRKWQDDNGDGRYNGGEAGLGGVTIYADSNFNGTLDRGETSAVTGVDNPDTDFDEGGLYSLHLFPGEHVIREVVPSGYVQTYPGTVDFIDPIPADNSEFHVVPPMIDIPGIPGEVFDLPVSISFDPVCFRAWEIDVVSSSPHAKVDNLSGIQVNGCGGDVSNFDLVISIDRPIPFEIQFIDTPSGSVLASIPVLTHGNGGFADGGHWLIVEPGGVIDAVDFGNARLAGGAVAGVVWSDVDGDGVREDGERGLAGVTVYADLNENGRFDPREPTAVTARDNRATDVDEAGRYELAGLKPGAYTIREVVPRNYQQTFPAVGGGVLATELGVLASGVALDLAATGVTVSRTGDAAVELLAAKLEMTVVWPDSCGTIIDGQTFHTVVGDNIIVDLSGHQVGDVCAEVISPQTVTVALNGLAPGRYEVIGVLNETLRDGTEVPTLTSVSLITLGGPGAHRVVVADGQTVRDTNFGNRSTLKPGAISGTKWNDQNGNGQRDAGELGLAGVTIYVDLNRNGVLDADEPTAITATEDTTTRFEEAGRYTIPIDATDQNYAVREVVPEGYQQTFPYPWIWLGIPDFGGQLPPDGDWDPIGEWWPEGGASHHEVYVPSGEVVEQIDFGNQKVESGGIAGTKWFDENSNGVRDENETGMGGVTIFIDVNFNGQLDADDPSRVTADDGSYAFSGLRPNTNYQVYEVVPAGYVQTSPVAWTPGWFGPIEVPFPLPEGPFPVEPDGGIGGPIYDHPFDGLPDVIVVDGIPVDPRIDPIDWLPETPYPFPSPFGEPIPVPHSVWVRSGEFVSGVDFGNAKVAPGSIQGVKWLDENGNGVREDSEPGVAGVTIFLDLNLNGRLDADESMVVTRADDPATAVDETGGYRFNNLTAQHYYVHEVVPAGMQQTYPREDLWFDWGQPVATGQLGAAVGHYVWVGNGANVKGVDFGNRPMPDPGTIEGTTWLDLNGDGARTDDETGLAGVTIFADVNNNGWLDRGEPLTKTNNSGAYVLSVPPGTFSIREQVPPGYLQTYPSGSPTVKWDVDLIRSANPVSAINFDLTDVALHATRADGSESATLTFEVTWRDGCGQVLPEMSEARSDGGEFAAVQLFGQVHAGFCDQAIHVQALMVDVDINPFQPLLVEASFAELPAGEGDLLVGPSYQLSAWVHWDIAGRSGHDVSIASGELLAGLDFGNMRVDVTLPPVPLAERADVDRDGVLSVNDIDALAAAIRADEAGGHDLSGDGRVDDADLDFLVHSIMRARYGDANMDGVFDSADLVKVFTAGEYEDEIRGNSNWETGDWNGDGEFTSSDLVKAFQDGYSI